MRTHAKRFLFLGRGNSSNQANTKPTTSVSTVNNGQVKEIASGVMMMVMLEVMERRGRRRSKVILGMMLLKGMMMMM